MAKDSSNSIKRSQKVRNSSLFYLAMSDFFLIFFGKFLARRTFFSPSVPGFPPSFSPEGGKWSSCSFSSFLELDDKSGEEEEEKSLHRCPPTKKSVFFGRRRLQKELNNRKGQTEEEGGNTFYLT